VRIANPHQLQIRASCKSVPAKSAPAKSAPAANPCQLQIPESRRKWLLDRFEFAGRYNKKIEFYKFWQDGNEPKEVYSEEFLQQNIAYIHNNPVRAGWVNEPQHYKYSSAIDYAGEKGLIDVIFAY